MYFTTRNFFTSFCVALYIMVLFAACNKKKPNRRGRSLLRETLLGNEFFLLGYIYQFMIRAIVRLKTFLFRLFLPVVLLFHTYG
jgi:hypothetical protein